MDREILYRGKRVADGKWVYGDLSQRQLLTFIEFYDMNANGKKGKYHEAAVDIETVGQYIGLTDNNGKLMFEGDIVKLEDYHGERTVYIFWGNSGSWFYGGDGYSDEYIFNSHEREVIGNIYDNKQMLGRADMPVPDDVSQPVLMPATPENFELIGG